MPEFRAQWFEPAQGVRRAFVQADDPGSVAAVLGVPPAAVLRVDALPEPAPRTGAGRLDARLFCQELALLLQSGIPLLEALQTLLERNAEASALSHVITALREGLPLSQAMARAPGDFDGLLRSIVEASERSGQLPRSLRQHAAYLAWAEGLRARLLAAAIYPTMLLAVGLGVVGFLLLYVLPRFASVFDAMGDSVPAASRGLIAFGAWAGAHPTAVLGMAMLLPLAAVAAWRAPGVRAMLQQRIWAAPVIGDRWRVVALARLYRALAVLLAAGVPVPAALRQLQGVVPVPLRPALASGIAQVEAGVRLSAAMLDHGLATPVALRMVRVGEESGELPTMLERAASFHDEEIERLGEFIARAVNPALMLLMGILIGGVVVLMYLPIFTLMEQVQ